MFGLISTRTMVKLLLHFLISRHGCYSKATFFLISFVGLLEFQFDIPWVAATSGAWLSSANSALLPRQPIKT